MRDSFRNDSGWARRTLLWAAALVLAGLFLLRIPGLSAQESSASALDPQQVEDLVAANRILADQGVVDGYGHVSVRSKSNPNRYLISRSIAPELVQAQDILEYDLDSQPIGHQGPMYSERFIHGEIYKRRPDVHAVVHNHSPSVIPFSVSSTPLKALYHMSYFIAQGVPVFDIRSVAGMTNMLVSTPQLGRALAETLGDKAAVLMRGHGAVVVGADLPLAVGRSVYLEINARLQVQAMALGEVNYLDPAEAEKVNQRQDYRRAWDLWKRKVSGN